MTLFWPASSLVILAGFASCLILGTRSFTRALREGSQSRQGLFVWSASLLWYATMCIGGLFFHCLHIPHVPHILDLVGTGLSSLSVICGFLAFADKLDDRTPKQRCLYLLVCTAFIAVAIYAPPIIQEQLYVVPSLLATGVGIWFVLVGRATEKAKTVREARRWLAVAGAGVVVGLGAIPMDQLFCVTVGQNFGLLFWFFLGCNMAILATHQFAVAVTEKNLRFTDVKTH